MSLAERLAAAQEAEVALVSDAQAALADVANREAALAAAVAAFRESLDKIAPPVVVDGK